MANQTLNVVLEQGGTILLTFDPDANVVPDMRSQGVSLQKVAAFYADSQLDHLDDEILKLLKQAAEKMLDKFNWWKPVGKKPKGCYVDYKNRALYLYRYS